MGKKIRSDRPAEKQGGRTADFLLWFLEKNYWGNPTRCESFPQIKTIQETMTKKGRRL